VNRTRTFGISVTIVDLVCSCLFFFCKAYFSASILCDTGIIFCYLSFFVQSYFNLLCICFVLWEKMEPRPDSLCRPHPTPMLLLVAQAKPGDQVSITFWAFLAEIGQKPPALTN